MTARDWKRIDARYEPRVFAPNFNSEKFRDYFGCPAERLRKGRSVQEIEAAYYRTYRHAYRRDRLRVWGKDRPRYRMYFFSWAINWLAECLDRRLCDVIRDRYMVPLLNGETDEASYPWGKQVECVVNGRSYWYEFVASGGALPQVKKLSWPTGDRERIDLDEERRER